MVLGRTLVFLDASVLVAASRSPSGGSAVVMEVCHGQRFRAAVSALLLFEARHNIAEKFEEQELLRFYRQISDLDPEMVPPPSRERVEECIPLTTEKDAQVLAGALECSATYLITLDRLHLLNEAVESAGLSVTTITPGDFLRTVVT